MLNNTDSSQPSMVQENTVEQTWQEINTQPDFTFPPIAGFWRRFFAWSLDSLLLGIIGQVFGIVFSSFLFSIGPYGRPIGLLFVLPYFGIMNSKIGGGQTFGKRWMQIAVRNKNNEPIELWRSTIRIFLLALPALVNGWSVPILQNAIMTWLVSILIFGLGVVIFYTMIFNVKTRQGIHDMLLRTYVVHLPGKRIASFPVTSRIHWIVASGWISIVAVGILVVAFLSPPVASKSPVTSAKSLYNVLRADPHFFTVGVNNQTFHGSNGKTSHSLNIRIWYKGKIGQQKRNEVVNSIVKIVLDNEKNISNYDNIRVNLTSAYDNGIASGHINFWVANSIQGWRKEIYPTSFPNGFLPFFMAKAFANL